MLLNQKHYANTLYIFKILCCAIIIVILALLFDRNKDTNFFLWASLTAFFTLQIDLDKKINFNQVTGNFIGSMIGILIWIVMDRTPFIHTFSINLEYFFLILGILITTTFCILFRATEYTGIALSSFLIVTVYDVGHHTIDGALLRIAYCFVGCLVAYSVEYFSRYCANRFSPKR